MKVKLNPQDIQKVYDAALYNFKTRSHNALEPELQMVWAVISAYNVLLQAKGSELIISLPERQIYESVDSE